MYYKQSDSNCGTMSHRPHQAWAHFKKHFGPGMKNAHGRHAFGRRKSVNIVEAEDAYILKLYAAGLSKELFVISVDEDVLTIAYKPTKEAPTEQYIYAEYMPKPFERSFKLNEKVVKDHISATYIDGVLEITLPKNPAMHTPEQVIQVK